MKGSCADGAILAAYSSNTACARSLLYTVCLIEHSSPVYEGLPQSSRTTSWPSNDIIYHHYHRTHLSLTFNSDSYMLSLVPCHGFLITVRPRLHQRWQSTHQSASNHRLITKMASKHLSISRWTPFNRHLLALIQEATPNPSEATLKYMLRTANQPH